MSDGLEWVVIDRDEMKFIAKTDSLGKANTIAWCVPEPTTTVVLSLSMKSGFSHFGVLELILLYKNHSKEELPVGAIHEYGWMIAACFKLATELPMDTRTEAELEKLAELFPDEPFKKVKVPHRPIVVRARPDQQYSATTTPSIPNAPRAPRAPSAPGERPSKGATGRVWEVADQVHAENGGGAITKELRTKIIIACEAAGINAGTAATQFGKWKASKG